MERLHTQSNATHVGLGHLGASLQNFLGGMLGQTHVIDELSAAAARFDGLIDLIERAGWDSAQLERVRHAFDETAEELIAELLESYPEMSKAEQQSFVAPFYAALKRFAGLSARERTALRAEYARFKEVHSQTLAGYTDPQ